MNSAKKHLVPKIGEVYHMCFSGTGSEQFGWRPGVVFQNNVGNANSPNIIALPMTSSTKRQDLPTHVVIRSDDTGLKLDSQVLCENPQTLSKDKIGSYITHLSAQYMRDIAIANLTATSAIAFLDEGTLLETRRRAIRLNQTA